MALTTFNFSQIMLYEAKKFVILHYHAYWQLLQIETRKIRSQQSMFSENL